MAPKARRDRLKVRDIGSRVALLDERDGRVHVLDPVAAAIWRLADGRTSADELSELVAAKLGAEVSAESFARGMQDLEAAGLLHDTAALPRRSILAAAVLAPTVLTIGSSVAAGPAAAAASVMVCHRGKTIKVSPSAVAEHLAHGDTLGACGATTTSTTPTFTTTTSTTPDFTTTTSTTPGFTTTTSTTPDFTTTTSTTPTFTTTTSTTSTTPTFTTTTSTTQAPDPTTTSTTPAPTTTVTFA